MSRSTAALVLAAGRARRFGRQKLLAEIGGVPLVRWAVDHALQSSVDRVTVVVGHRADEVERALEEVPAEIVFNPDHEEGMGASIRRGVEAADAAAALVLLGDQPGVGPGLIDRIVGADPEGEATIVAPRYRDGPGNPVLFRASVFPELRSLEGDRGARSVVDRDPSRVRIVPIDRPRPRDVDTPGDLRKFQGMSRRRR